mgnify:FL=1|jgi:hypothetical protein|nr:MAG TPA: hypothetical protein [Caudoviricetes sp.]
MNRVVAFFSSDYDAFVVGKLVSEDLKSKRVILCHPLLFDWKSGAMMAFKEIYHGEDFAFYCEPAVNDVSTKLYEQYNDFLNNPAI